MSQAPAEPQDAVPDESLRGAIELAFVVAVHGTRQRPPIAAPSALKPYLRFQKLPSAALAPVRRAVETDDEFRARVAAVADEDMVGRAGWLWLQRPDEWEQEVRAVVAADLASEASASEARAERGAARRLEAAEAAARRAAAEAAALRAEADAERSRRRDVETALARLERRATQLEIELGGARRRAAEADEAVRLLELAARATPDPTVTDPAEEETPEGADRPDSDEPGTSERPVPLDALAVSDSAPANAVDLDALAGSLRDAAVAASSLGDAISAAAKAFAAALASAGDALGGPPSAVSDETVAGRSGRAPSPPLRVARPRRSPLALPGGLFADSVEAANHLVRAPGALVLVDGYNVAKLGWPDLPLATQRQRLLDALDELVARYGTQIEVVFDGADVGTALAQRRLVRVDFSAPGVSADDVIVQRVASLPAEQPVVVATNDAEVRDGARANGANVISSRRLLDVARRV